FEALVPEYAGDRERFTSMMASLSREAAEELDLRSKKSAYRAMSHLWGVDAGVAFRCDMVLPGSAQGTLDLAVVGGYLDFHRLRSSAPMRVPPGRVSSSP